jgi:hypothetical protein
MSHDKIRYDLLVQNALKSVLRKVLTDVVQHGLPAEHHFFISFRTDAPGVRVSSRLREKYPDEMTIVLQHQFWELSVTEHTFEVGLSFSGIPEKLLIPFDAITAFFDPSVQFGLKFEIGEVPDEEPGESMNDGDDFANDTTDTVQRLHPAKRSAPRAVKERNTHDQDTASKPISTKETAKKAKKVKSSDDVESKASAGAPAEQDEADAGATVVSLDAFRRRSTAADDDN